MTNVISRAFGGRRRVPDELADRLPPGQCYESGFPVLTAGPTPQIDTDAWGFRIDGMVAEEREWTWEEFQQLPFEQVSVDALLGSTEGHGAYATGRRRRGRSGGGPRSVRLLLRVALRPPCCSPAAARA